MATALGQEAVGLRFLRHLRFHGRADPARPAMRGEVMRTGVPRSEEKPSPKILQQTYAYGPAAVLGGERFLMSGVPL